MQACSCCPALQQHQMQSHVYCMKLHSPNTCCKPVQTTLPALNIPTPPALVMKHICLQIVGITSCCLDADSPDKAARQVSAAALRQELEWGMHLGLQACLLPLPSRLHNANFAQVINQVHLPRQPLHARGSLCRCSIVLHAIRHNCWHKDSKSVNWMCSSLQ